MALKPKKSTGPYPCQKTWSTGKNVRSVLFSCWVCTQFFRSVNGPKISLLRLSFSSVWILRGFCFSERIFINREQRPLKKSLRHIKNCPHKAWIVRCLVTTTFTKIRKQLGFVEIRTFVSSKVDWAFWQKPEPIKKAKKVKKQHQQQ